jgi:hypothetical protein
MNGMANAKTVAGLVLNPNPRDTPAAMGYIILLVRLIVFIKKRTNREKKRRQVPSAMRVLEYPKKKGEVRQSREEIRAM